MSVYELNKARRTVRKFQQKPIDEAILMRLLDAARVSPSGANLQPMRYRIISDEAGRNALFPYLKWAGYLPDGTPKEGERPMAYIVAVHDERLRPSDAPYDAGAALMAMTLCAQEEGICSCWIGSINRKEVQRLYGLDEKMRIVLVLALGYPAEESVTAAVDDEHGIRYWMDENQVLHVPKRSLEDILF